MAFVNGLHGLSNVTNQARKQAARSGADAQAATDEAARLQAKADRKAAANAPAVDPVAASLGFDVPKKIAGIPTWMLMAGGLMAAMFVFKGGRR